MKNIFYFNDDDDFEYSDIDVVDQLRINDHFDSSIDDLEFPLPEHEFVDQGEVFVKSS